MIELKTVEHVDVKRYMGAWFEIAKLPQRFEKGLVGIKASYTLLPDGKVEVLNSGYKEDFNGKMKTIKGKAWVADTATNAKLKVSFFWPFTGNYWIIELGKDYEYAVVGDEPENIFGYCQERLKWTRPYTTNCSGGCRTGDLTSPS
jgi:apolipoprotein D and lipocalin family protein